MDDRGIKTGGDEGLLDTVVPDNEVDAAFGTNTGALTAWAVKDACGGDSGCGLRDHQSYHYIISLKAHVGRFRASGDYIDVVRQHLSRSEPRTEG
jgi:hypothetical protein